MKIKIKNIYIQPCIFYIIFNIGKLKK
jgi:hypothetical protein